MTKIQYFLIGIIVIQLAGMLFTMDWFIRKGHRFTGLHFTACVFWFMIPYLFIKNKKWKRDYQARQANDQSTQTSAARSNPVYGDGS